MSLLSGGRRARCLEKRGDIGAPQRRAESSGRQALAVRRRELRRRGLGQEQLQALEIGPIRGGMLAGSVQRGVTCSVCELERGAVVEEELDGRGVPASGRKQQRGLALAVLQVERRPAADQHRGRLALAGVAGQHERAPPFAALLVHGGAALHEPRGDLALLGVRLARQDERRVAQVVRRVEGRRVCADRCLHRGQVACPDEVGHARRARAVRHPLR
mmetsp:Transcript_11230/g.28267  ORF Transcript_11230/g.28267 Transcript_11230/m.28267 type:complete len:217 (-) Transcript_11230:66-716(-)